MLSYQCQIQATTLLPSDVLHDVLFMRDELCGPERKSLEFYLVHIGCCANKHTHPTVFSFDHCQAKDIGYPNLGIDNISYLDCHSAVS